MLFFYKYSALPQYKGDKEHGECERDDNNSREPPDQKTNSCDQLNRFPKIGHECRCKQLHVYHPFCILIHFCFIKHFPAVIDHKYCQDDSNNAQARVPKRRRGGV